MSTLTRLSKEHVGRGIFKYTYLCQCQPDKTKIIEVQSGNDSSADLLAQLECDEFCENDMRDSSHSEVFKRLINMEKPLSKFAVWVNAIDKDSLHVELCTGGKIILPKSVLENFKTIAITESGDKINQIGLVSINTSTPEGLAIYQLSEIIKNLHESRGGGTNKEAFGILGEVSQTVSVRCTGTACRPSYTYINSDYPIVDFALNRAEDCSVMNVIRLGSKQLRIMHDALNGTPCGNGYGGTVWIDMVWNKPD